MVRKTRRYLLRAPNAYSVVSPVSCARRIANLDYVLLSGRMAKEIAREIKSAEFRLEPLSFADFATASLSRRS
jgi:hypothetical protein